MEKKRLGRGLNALFGAAADGAVAEATQETEVEIDRIQQNPHQPRKTFDKDELASLSESVRHHGILQPLVVRQVGDDYQLIAGERRLRAAREAGLTTVPIRLVDFNDQQVLEAALVENIQRADLNPIEKAQGFKEYLDRFGMSHDHLAQRLGLARSSITNLVNLLELPAEVQEGLRIGQLSEAHAKLLKGVKSPQRQVALFKQVVAMGLSVKATEALVREEKESRRAPAEDSDASDAGAEKTNHVRSLEDELRQRLATHVEIRLRGKDKGHLLIRFETNDDFERLLEQLRR